MSVLYGTLVDDRREAEKMLADNHIFAPGKGKNFLTRGRTGERRYKEYVC